MIEDLSIEVLDARRKDVADLLQRADDYLLRRYPPDLCFLDDAQALARPEATLLGAFVGGALMGVGALKRQSGPLENYGEIKRVFVADEARGRGLGKALVDALEGLALQEELPVIRLETGTEQPEAVALYRRLGYRTRGPYGDYPDNPYSIFMEKHLRLQDP
ncbi:GNAT family N-acetyltransferase [Gilvimarinus sp. F26214L]|uniref:GNAT family N-acetyltransferase n=1 Tax=Gilvimarinus sp. DZF01 TaxID=3461371 RepID=UPI0040460889